MHTVQHWPSVTWMWMHTRMGARAVTPGQGRREELQSSSKKDPIIFPTLISFPRNLIRSQSSDWKAWPREVLSTFFPWYLHLLIHSCLKWSEVSRSSFGFHVVTKTHNWNGGLCRPIRALEKQVYNVRQSKQLSSPWLSRHMHYSNVIKRQGERETK